MPSKGLPDWASLELSPSVESCGCKQNLREQLRLTAGIPRPFWMELLFISHELMPVTPAYHPEPRQVDMAKEDSTGSLPFSGAFLQATLIGKFETPDPTVTVARSGRAHV